MEEHGVDLGPLNRWVVNFAPLVAAQAQFCNIGLVTLTFRSLNSFMRPFVQMPRDFYHLATSACALDYKIR